MDKNPEYVRPLIYVVFPNSPPFLPRLQGGKWLLGFRFASKRGPERITTGYGVMTAQQFRYIRDTLNAWIETDEKERICAALGVTEGEPGIRGLLSPEQRNNP